MIVASIELSDNVLIEKGTNALLKELGYAGFIKYLRLLTNGNNDYLKVQDEIYKERTVDEIFDEANETWNT